MKLTMKTHTVNRPVWLSLPPCQVTGLDVTETREEALFCLWLCGPCRRQGVPGSPHSDLASGPRPSQDSTAASDPPGPGTPVPLERKRGTCRAMWLMGTPCFSMQLCPRWSGGFPTSYVEVAALSILHCRRRRRLFETSYPKASRWASLRPRRARTLCETF